MKELEGAGHLYPYITFASSEEGPSRYLSYRIVSYITEPASTLSQYIQKEWAGNVRTYID